MNIDFADHAGFSAYVLLLMFSGAAMVVMGSPVLKHQRALYRALNLLFGVGFFGYGFYLAFLFHGGTYVIFFKAFIVPVLMIVRTVQATRRARPSALPAVPAVPDHVPAPTQWVAPPAPAVAAAPPPPWVGSPAADSPGRHRQHSESV